MLTHAAHRCRDNRIVIGKSKLFQSIQIHLKQGCLWHLTVNEFDFCAADTCLAANIEESGIVEEYNSTTGITLADFVDLGEQLYAQEAPNDYLMLCD